MKRKITLVVSVLFALALVLALASCGHEHAFKTQWEKDATNHWHICEVEGEECAEVSDKAAHTFVQSSKTDATCTSDGSIVEKCSVCGYEKTTTVPKIAHSWDDATCTVAKTCKTCGATEGALASHKGGVATCTDKAVCEVCEQPYGEEPQGHKGGEATCTDKAVCEVCEQPYGEEPQGHKGGKATCTDKAVCEVCEQPYGEEPQGHKGGEATCQSAALCQTCGAAYGEIGTHKGGEATCQAKATCETCGEEYGELADHDYKETVTEPTCKDGGFTTVTCNTPGCDYTETKDETDPTGEHKGGEATCQAKATCETCGEEYGELADHDYKETVTEPTCKDGGFTTVTCNTPGCDYTETKDETDPTGEHKGGEATCKDLAKCEICGQGYGTLNDHSWVDADCVSPKHCTVCAETEGEALGHTLVEVNECGVIKCTACQNEYVNVSTVVSDGNGILCLGCGKTPCTCSVVVEWSGYTKPSAPEKLTAGETFTKSEVPEDGATLEIGGGLILLTSESEAGYTVTVGDDVIEVSGTAVVIDLSAYESVTTVTIVSDADAEVVFYEIIK